MLAELLEYVADVPRRLLTQYRAKPKLVGVLQVAAAQAQELESQLWLLLLQMSYGYYGPTVAPGDQRVSPAGSGIWLDYVGARVGEARNGLADAFYATQIAARVLANKSSGTIPELYDVVYLAMFGNKPIADLSIVRGGTASIEIDLGEETDLAGEARMVAAKVRIARAAGVGAMILFNEENDALTFTFSSSAAMEPSAFQGFGNSSNPATGGAFAGAILA